MGVPADGWLSRTLRPKKVPVPWAAAVRAGAVVSAGPWTAAWWPEVVALQRIGEAVIEAAVQARSGAAVPSSADVTATVAGLRRLAAAVQEWPVPASPGPLPGSGPLAGVAQEIRTAWSALPASDRPRDPGTRTAG
ncbi:hypothetical protein SAMN05216275_107192 [Streptosporangium canum]|uniref:Uncharacterized protein n=1 Tax=Streptosporangium canum TaxID=324952 RepID=A0A1I3PTD5_9ACTN|nr:hypothetical protein [Streptosporangium canum]SFJ24587.1 hypothetical protein SAMN05216275_107192 [Streptosporangium canum]